ncbi:uncharacterized protein LOC62_06G008577 [Vanrija pseudolonga]|uniref:Uncharacterized protein n=1 Tax=Vanrija pseudolonga TaxID=143232 RepID=A0AAF1BLJ0_9TREE|nr:hypothetical protein LOC62_06G008577 [Vanrija pseudolonga]
MLILPTILAPLLLATTAWAQSNSTAAANRTEIPAPFNGTFNTDNNATILYPKASNYSLTRALTMPKGPTRIIVTGPSSSAGRTRRRTPALQPNARNPTTNKDWPKDQTWCQYQLFRPELLGGRPGSGYFLSIYLGNSSASRLDPPAYGKPLAVSELFEIRNTTTIDPSLPKGPNKLASPTRSSQAVHNRPSSGLITAIGAVVCVAAICAL